MTLLSAAATLLLILDPFGNLPLFHGILGKVPEARRRPVLIREILIAYVILMVFLLVGTPLLRFLGLEQSALSLAGGILLFLIAIGMVFPRSGMHTTAEGDDEPFIVPLATPLIAGPSGIAFVLLLASREPSRLMDWLVAVTLASAVSAAILIGGERIMQLLGHRGMRAMERLMGMLLILIAVQMMMNGLSLYLATLRAG
jgi:multiple antibiotic resistance protein